MIVSKVIGFLLTQAWITSANLDFGSGQQFKNMLCPNLPSAYEYRIHAETKKCYQVGLRGPCRIQSKLIFVKQEENVVYGECACDPEADRKLVYHNQTNQCYSIFGQGYCPTGHWITLDLDGKTPVCELNPCHEQNKNNSPYDFQFEWVLFNGNCVQLRRSDENVCPPPQFVTFEKGNLNPTCGCPKDCVDGPCPVSAVNEINAMDELFKKTACPELNNTERYRIDRKTNKCYEVSTYRRGPCGPNMIFTSQSDNVIYGICDCNPHERRTLIYHKSTDQCYFIFQQAYCPKNQWLTFNRVTRLPICELNPCRNRNQGKGKRDTFGDKEFVAFNGQCVVLGEKSNDCEEHQGVAFVRGKILPTCSYPIGCGGVASIAPVMEAPCTAGSQRALTGKCAPSWVW